MVETIPGTLTTAQVARLIRADLKAAFPTAKIPVTSKSFLAGDYVVVEWQDGPSYKEVEPIATRYGQRGSDPNTDAAIQFHKGRYEGFVLVRRHVTDELADRLANMVTHAF